MRTADKDWAQTHNVTLVSPIAHFVVALTPDGRISSQGTLKSALEKDSALLDADPEKFATIEPRLEPQTDKKAPESVDGKLIAEEDVLEGHVGWSACAYQYIHPRASMTDPREQYSSSSEIRRLLHGDSLCSGQYSSQRRS